MRTVGRAFVSPMGQSGKKNELKKNSGKKNELKKNLGGFKKYRPIL